MESVTFPISSRKIVPPLASSKRPNLRRSAPVKAPFSCPNSSDSASVSGIAAQLNLMNGPFRRGEMLWMMRATRPLPVPDSPRNSTVECPLDALRMENWILATASEPPTIESRCFSMSTSRRSDSFSSESRVRASSSSSYSRAFSMAMAAWSENASRKLRSFCEKRCRAWRWST